jgi:hypothetical protein
VHGETFTLRLKLCAGPKGHGPSPVAPLRMGEIGRLPESLENGSDRAVHGAVADLVPAS